MPEVTPIRDLKAYLGSEQVEELIDVATNPRDKLLVLDDVGVDPPSQWLSATYWTVFDRRLEWQLPVVVTTNRHLEAPQGQVCLADRIGTGGVSRLIELCLGKCD